MIIEDIQIMGMAGVLVMIVGAQITNHVNIGNLMIKMKYIKRQPTEQELIEYRLFERDDYNKIDIITDVEFIIEYKGAKIPVYMDDYGQQYFYIIKGKEYGLGAYNTCLDEICDVYDYNKG